MNPPRAIAAVAEVLPDAVALSLMEHCIESGLDRAKRILART
jgi:lysozyme family protein